MLSLMFKWNVFTLTNVNCLTFFTSSNFIGIWKIIQIKTWYLVYSSLVPKLPLVITSLNLLSNSSTKLPILLTMTKVSKENLKWSSLKTIVSALRNLSSQQQMSLSKSHWLLKKHLVHQTWNSWWLVLLPWQHLMVPTLKSRMKLAMRMLSSSVWTRTKFMNTMHVTITTLVQFMKITQSFVVSLIPLLTVRFQMLNLKVLKFMKPSSPTTMSTSSWKTSLLM